MNIDLLAFLKAGAENAPIVIMAVLALTYVAGEFGLKGKGQLAFALGSGLLAGGGLQLATTGTPADFAGWFWLVVYAVILSIFPVLLYEQAKSLLEKAASKFTS